MKLPRSWVKLRFELLAWIVHRRLCYDVLCYAVLCCVVLRCAGPGWAGLGLVHCHGGVLSFVSGKRS